MPKRYVCEACQRLTASIYLEGERWVCGACAGSAAELPQVERIPVQAEFG